MPERASPRDASAVSPLRAARLLLWFADAVLIIVGIACALLLAVRFVVFPQIESRRLDIAAALSKRIGQPVEIDSIATGWDGWNPKLSVRGFRIRASEATAA